MLKLKGIPKDKAQIFECPYAIPCDTFNCYRTAKYFIGRPDGPLNLCIKLCEECAASVLQSAVLEEGAEEEVTEVAEEVTEEVIEDAASDATYTCPHCGEKFPTPQALAVHVRWNHRGE